MLSRTGHCEQMYFMPVRLWRKRSNLQCYIQVKDKRMRTKAEIAASQKALLATTKDVGLLRRFAPRKDKQYAVGFQ